MAPNNFSLKNMSVCLCIVEFYTKNASTIIKILSYSYDPLSVEAYYM